MNNDNNWDGRYGPHPVKKEFAQLITEAAQEFKQYTKGLIEHRRSARYYCHSSASSILAMLVMQKLGSDPLDSTPDDMEAIVRVCGEIESEWQKGLYPDEYNDENF